MALIIQHNTRQLAHNWWAILLRGIVALLIAAVTFIVPEATLIALVVLFAVYALLDGVFLLVIGFRGRRERPRWWVQIVQGLLSIGAGIVALTNPQLVALFFLYLVAAWAIFTGATEIIAAIQLRKEIRGEWLLILSGLASVALGIILMALPAAGLLVWLYLIGGFALISGILLIVLALRMRKLDAPAVTVEEVEVIRTSGE
ncbi:hypothetical protein LEM8419_00407 [Neolewinella maritima]|uniref:HdeD family acid-resistance protein n=1 Tax=Neolewinella maritima TaxID=1383882 RepID=A0ABN8EZ42_9BACT|nr:HdeD family acid-resistance protein [Neolewinella maritima]CAH0999111.1 hypothetical protein LEM8419_00407 [Neolewinella maritima]